MAGRPGFFGGTNQTGTAERDPDLVVGPGGLVGASPFIRLGDPNAPRLENGFSAPPGFDPVWGTLGAPTAQAGDDWLTGARRDPEGISREVEILGDGFQISGEIHMGQFDRLSDWLNMQTGFIQIQNAWHVHLGQTQLPASDQRKGTLWVKLNQVVLMAERAPAQQSRPGAPVVQKQRRKVSIVTPGYNLTGSIHLVAYGSISQFLESPDPHFLPVTDLTVRWLSDPAMVGRYPFALINREEMVTLLDETEGAGGDSAQNGGDSEDQAFQRRFGAA